MTATTWVEDRVLDYFWAMSRVADVDRVELLRQVADVQLARASDWDTRAVRRALDGVSLTLTAERCFACRTRTRLRHWHHVIQVQHGGSNQPRNLVSLCSVCHRRVHPWLSPRPYRPRRGVVRVRAFLHDAWAALAASAWGARATRRQSDDPF